MAKKKATKKSSSRPTKKTKKTASASSAQKKTSSSTARVKKTAKKSARSSKSRKASRKPADLAARALEIAQETIQHFDAGSLNRVRIGLAKLIRVLSGEEDEEE